MFVLMGFFAIFLCCFYFIDFLKIFVNWDIAFACFGITSNIESVCLLFRDFTESAVACKILFSGDAFDIE